MDGKKTKKEAVICFGDRHAPLNISFCLHHAVIRQSFLSHFYTKTCGGITLNHEVALTHAGIVQLQLTFMC